MQTLKVKEHPLQESISDLPHDFILNPFSFQPVVYWEEVRVPGKAYEL